MEVSVSHSSRSANFFIYSFPHFTKKSLMSVPVGHPKLRLQRNRDTNLKAVMKILIILSRMHTLSCLGK
jgi:hypothetical protein